MNTTEKNTSNIPEEQNPAPETPNTVEQPLEDEQLEDVSGGVVHVTYRLPTQQEEPRIDVSLPGRRKNTITPLEDAYPEEMGGLKR
jgi:hypothetical protein